MITQDKKGHPLKVIFSIKHIHNMTDIKTFFKVTINEVNENLKEANIPYIEIIDNQEQHKTNINGEKLYWEVFTEGFTFQLAEQKGGLKGVLARTLFVSFKRDNKPHKIELELKDAKVYGALATINGSYIFASFGSAPLDLMHRQLIMTIDKGFKDAITQFKDQIFEKTIDPSMYTYRNILYQSTKENNDSAWISGITFPEVKGKINEVLPCYCKLGEGLAKEYGRVCGKPFNYVSTERSKKIMKIKSKKLLEEKLDATVKNEIYNASSLDKAIKDVKEFDEKCKDSSYKDTQEYSIKSRRIALTKKYLEDVKSASEEDRIKAKTDFQDIMNRYNESEKKRYCYGTINNEIPPNAIFEKYKVEISHAVISSAQKKCNPKVICTDLLWKSNEKEVKNLEDEFA